ncbi:hypothetical protein ACFFX0_31555 [Citricoccus parietis]|uniref:Uncharacterized protein n=1 Tax=Citricoccus parietis TaxID=592307 RepID=A0ABV5G961_9MICC
MLIRHGRPFTRSSPFAWVGLDGDRNYGVGTASAPLPPRTVRYRPPYPPAPPG